MSEWEKWFFGCLAVVVVSLIASLTYQETYSSELEHKQNMACIEKTGKLCER